MHNRYQKPAALPPSLAFLEIYLRDARPTLSERLAEPEATEMRRVEAVAALLALARTALAETGDRNRLGAIPRGLREFLTIEGLRILTDEDPIVSLQRFLGQRTRRRGRPRADNAFRDLMIAADVAELHARGKALSKAFEMVSTRPGTPGCDEIERVYYRLRDDLAVRAELGWRWLRTAGNADDSPPPKIEGQKEITSEQWEEYSALVAAECPNGMTVEDNLELWSFVRRASFPHKITDLLQ
jgi:hypothetical protein